VYYITLKFKKIKSLLYSLNTLSGVTSERYPSLPSRFCAKGHTSKSQWWWVDCWYGVV